MKFTCSTIGELKAALSNWPDDKPLIQDSNGDTSSLTIEDWSLEPSDSLDWPVVVYDLANEEAEDE